MSEPGGGAINVRTRKRGYRCQNQVKELKVSEPGGGVTVVKFRRRGYRLQNHEEDL